MLLLQTNSYSYIAILLIIVCMYSRIRVYLYFTAPPHPSCPPIIYSGPILMNSMKKSSKDGENQPLFTCQASCTKVKRLLSIIMLSEQVQYQ